jgi:hypothetical protein
VAQAPKAPAPALWAVGDLPVLALFAKAKTHLRWPMTRAERPEIDNTMDVDGFAVRLTIAGPKAQAPGQRHRV